MKDTTDQVTDTIKMGLIALCRQKFASPEWWEQFDRQHLALCEHMTILTRTMNGNWKALKALGPEAASDELARLAFEAVAVEYDEEGYGQTE